MHVCPYIFPLFAVVWVNTYAHTSTHTVCTQCREHGFIMWKLMWFSIYFWPSLLFFCCCWFFVHGSEDKQRQISLWSYLSDILCLSQGPSGPPGPTGAAVNNLFIFISLSNETDAHRTPLSDVPCLIFRVWEDLQEWVDHRDPLDIM